MANSTALKVDRHKQILALINARKSISISELEDQLEIPRITIQRDLIELENTRLIRRFHGGAMSNAFSREIYNYEEKKSVHVAAKKKIAEKASRLLQDKQAVCFDASSTVYYLSETMLPSDLTILACSIDVFRNVSVREDIQTVFAGGRFNRKTGLMYGSEMISIIRKFHFDCAFISAEAFVPGRGFFDPHEDSVDVKRALIESSEKTVVMIDSSKVTSGAGICICENSEVDFVVTDDPEKSPIKEVFRDRLL